MARRQSTLPQYERSLPSKTLVVDPGAYSIKAGFTTTEPPSESRASPNNCSVIPNCIAQSRTKQKYIGSALKRCRDFGEMAFKRPVEKGYIVNWDAERAIWEHEFFDKNANLHCDPSETNLILTEPPNAPQALQSNSDQIIFEEFEFASAYRCVGASLNTFNDNATLFSDPLSNHDPPLPTEIMLLIDAGNSHTHIIPLLRGQPLNQSLSRLDIGGKHLTNYLAELISLRHISLIDEPYLVSQIKEDACFVSQDFHHDLERSWKGNRSRFKDEPSLAIDYVLPDYERLHHGFVREHDTSHAAKMARLGVANAANAMEGDDVKEDTVPLANERFTVPELLFSPGDVGMRESGIPETVMQCLAKLPRVLWQGLLGNVVLVGGTSLFPGYVERVEAGIRMLAPAEVEVRVRRADDPVRNTWLGGARMAERSNWLNDAVITREEYLEHGEPWVRQQFAARRVVKEWPSI